MPKRTAQQTVYFTSAGTDPRDLVSLLADVPGVTRCEPAAENRAASRWYLDTRGGAVGRKDIVLEATDDGDRLELVVRPRLSERVRWAVPLGTLPERIDEVPQPAVKAFLAGLKRGKGRLQPREAPRLTVSSYDLRDARDKLLGTVTLERPADAAGPSPLIRVRTRPGYARIGGEVARALVEGGMEPLPATDPMDWWRATPPVRDKACHDDRRRSASTGDVDAAIDTAAATLASYAGLMATHRDGVIEDRDPEHLHQFRVSLRRSRSLFEALKPLLVKARYKTLARELKRLNRVAGARRDLDVLGELLPPRLAGHGEATDPCAAHVSAVLATERARAHAKLVAYLNSGRYDTLVTAWSTFIDDLAAHDPKAVDHEAFEQLPPIGTLVSAAYDRALDLGRIAMASRVRSELHDTRKAIKRLRYLIDGFSGALPKSAVAVIVEDTKALQKAFGHFCDLELEQDFLELTLSRASDDAPPGFDAFAAGEIAALGQDIHDQVQLCAWRFQDFQSERVKTQVALVAGRA